MEFQLTKYNLDEANQLMQKELDEHNVLILTLKPATVGKWGMAKLWYSWMASAAKFMAANGSKMPLMIKSNGEWYGSRPFNEKDAHELFTSQWLGVDEKGIRLSWAKGKHDGMRPASKGERWIALRKMEIWCVEKGINILNPRDSEYRKLTEEQEK